MREDPQALEGARGLGLREGDVDRLGLVDGGACLKASHPLLSLGQHVLQVLTDCVEGLLGCRGRLPSVGGLDVLDRSFDLFPAVDKDNGST